MPLPFPMAVVHATAGSRAPARVVPREEPWGPASFRDVYDVYFDFVWTCARRLGVPVEAIDDVVQEVFIVVHARYGTLERPASLRSWVYGVDRRTASMNHRGRNARSARESAAPALDELTDAMQPSPLDIAVLGDELKVLWRFLAALDAPKREVLVLAELEEMTAPEIAEAVGIPLNTAYSRLRVARQEFSEIVARALAREKPRK